MIIDNYSMDPIGFMTNIYIYIIILYYIYTYMSYVVIHSVGTNTNLQIYQTLFIGFIHMIDIIYI